MSGYFSISRKNGVTELILPKVHKDKECLKVSSNFAFLLPRNCNNISGKAFSDVIMKSCDSPQARAVSNALINV